MKLYKTILADCPWKYNDKLDPSRRLPYPTMSVDELCKLPIKNFVDDEAHLYFWVTSAFLFESEKIIEAWGFDYKIHIPWIKRTKNGKLWFGMGNYFRHCNELLLFATRGNLKTRTKNTRNLLDAKKPDRHHSAKPDEAYDLIERNSYPPYLELFATVNREGWDSYGYDIDGEEIVKKLEQIGDFCAI